MFEAVHDVTSRGIQAYTTKPRHEWALDWPGMVVLVVTGLFWTRDVEEALADGLPAAKLCEARCTSELMKVRACGPGSWVQSLTHLATQR